MALAPAVLFPVLAGLIALFLNSSNRLLPFFVCAGIVPTIYYSSTTAGQMLGHAGGPAWLVLQLGNVFLIVCAGIVYWLLERRILR